MIPRLLEWSFVVLPEGVAMIHPQGASVATIHYRERSRPVRRITNLVRMVLAGWPQFTVETMGPLERFTTNDGEYAAAISIRGIERGLPVQRDLGFVLTDDFFSSATLTCWSKERSRELSLVHRTLVRADVHALGVRRRRFEYTPPPSYQPLKQSLAVEWIPPDYPRNASTILVHPANPREGYGTADLGRVREGLEQLGYTVSRVEPPARVTARSGLGGEIQLLAFEKRSEPAALRASVLLQDDLYAYPIELTCRSPDRWAEARAVLDELVQSIQPLPDRTKVSQKLTTFSHWAD